MERWPSGLRRTPGKCVEVKASRGFESLSLRHISNLKKYTEKLRKHLDYKELNFGII